MMWVIIALVYLGVGFFFSQPDSWGLPMKVIMHILWLPTMIFFFIIVIIYSWEERKRRCKR